MNEGDAIGTPTPRTRRDARADARNQDLRDAYDAMIARDGRPLDQPAPLTSGNGRRGDSGKGSATGSDQSQRRRRRWPWIVFPILLVLLVIGAATAVLVKQALDVRSDLTDAKAGVSSIIAKIRAGETDGIDPIAANVTELTTRANDTVQNPLWGVASAIPFVGQNVSAVSQTTIATHILVRDALPPALDLLGAIDVKHLKLEGGAFNLQPFRDAQTKLPVLSAAFAEAKSHIDTIDETTILPFVNESIAQLVDVVEQASPALATVEKYLPVALKMLGDGTERNYILLFQNNAEIRAVGGNSATSSVLNIYDGRIEIRSADDRDVRRFQARGYTGEGLGWPAEGVSTLFEPDTASYVQNFTRFPDFPMVGGLFSKMWTQTTGSDIDAVLAIDPVVLSYMLKVAGPVTVPGEKQKLTSENVVKVLLSDTYERFGKDGDAADAYFAKVVSAVFTTILESSWDPIAMFDEVSKAIEEQRVYAWFPDEADQAMAVELGFAGQLDATATTETQLGIFLNNASYSKLEYYLTTSMDITCNADARTVTSAITLNSSVPSANLSGYTLAWRNGIFGLPGTTMLLDVFSFAVPGGQLTEVNPAKDVGRGFDRSGSSNGRDGKSVLIALPMGQTKTVSFTSTVPEGVTAPLTVRYSPTVTKTPVTIADSCLTMFPGTERPAN